MANCPHCGIPYEIEGTCTTPGCPASEAAATALATKPAKPAPSLPIGGSAMVEVPRPPLPRRLGGSALELFTLLGIELLGTILSPLTWGITGALTSVIDAVYMSLKDLGGGRWSFGKRAVSARVVDVTTLDRADNLKCFLRNLPYVIAWAIAILPLVGDFIGWSALGLLALVDLGMIIWSPTGRRVGDYIAGTQVVAEERTP
ncbi:MAG: RDD family protein [Pseudomonadota bacterium]